jgi:cytoskeletal protein CcmA (bactofilin family)
MFSNKIQNQQSKKENAAAGGGLLNIIGSGTKLTGDIVSEGDIRVDGSIEGHVTVRQRLVLGEGGSIHGDIDAREAVVAGFIRGNITVGETLVLKPSAKIDGDIATGKIIIESGASFNGRCSMNAHVSQIKPKASFNAPENIGSQA